VAFGEDYRPIPVSQLDLHAFGHSTPPTSTIAPPLGATVEAAAG
jgi:hypothetical protein